MFRFTIRDVLWLTMVVALGAGWGIDRTRRSGQTPQTATEEKYEVIMSGKDS